MEGQGKVRKGYHLNGIYTISMALRPSSPPTIAMRSMRQDKDGMLRITMAIERVKPMIRELMTARSD